MSAARVDLDTVPLGPPWDWRRALLAGSAVAFIVLGVVSLRVADVSPSRLVAGAGDMTALIDRMLPVRIVESGAILGALAETFFMAFAGTALAVALSVPIAFLAARNTTFGPIWLAVARGVIVSARAIPDLVFALIFVRALGLGVLPGILALGLHSIGMLGKLFADAIEEIDEGPREAAQSVGAGRIQVLTTGVLPQILPSVIGRSLYRLDINVRLSTVLGFVGAGGIGQLLRTYLGNLRYAEALGVVVFIVLLVIAVELMSAAVRRTLLGGTERRGRKRTRARNEPGLALRPPWTPDRRWAAFYGALLALALVASMVVTGVSPLDPLFALPEILGVVARFFPPDVVTGVDSLAEAMLETVAIGVAATLLGTILSVPVAFLAARNIAPARWIYYAARYLIVLVRGIPELILAVVFVAAVGLGPFPGVMALAVASLGFLAKLLADAIEEVAQGPRDAIDATGATRLQQTITAVVPQLTPAFVGNVLYMLDINIRSSVVLGIVGAGGVGFLLIQTVRNLAFERTAGILLAVFVLVYAIERLSGWIRRQLI